MEECFLDVVLARDMSHILLAGAHANRRYVGDFHGLLAVFFEVIHSVHLAEASLAQQLQTQILIAHNRPVLLSQFATHFLG
jgi:hypothetical protein